MVFGILMESSLDDRKSTTLYLFKIGVNAISWCSKKQSIAFIFRG